jgi:uncharacterized protein (TIGR03085 family)
MTRFASSERQGLCDTFERVGPDAPTLCSPWLTRDLAAHLVVRERRPDVSAGILVPFLAGRLAKVQDGYAAWEWSKLVNEVRSGPPVWSPASLGPVNEAMNTAEFFVHHEDVLRGGPQWRARKIPDDLESALWGIAGPRMANGRSAPRQIWAPSHSPAHPVSCCSTPSAAETSPRSTCPAPTEP